MHRTRFHSWKSQIRRADQFEPKWGKSIYSVLELIQFVVVCGGGAFKKSYKIQIKNHVQALPSGLCKWGVLSLKFYLRYDKYSTLTEYLMVIYTKCPGNANGRITFSYTATISLNVRKRSLLILSPMRFNWDFIKSRLRLANEKLFTG